MQPAASEDVVVISDSDIAVDPHYVASLVTELQEPGVGAVTCAYHGTPAGGIWAQLSAMSINLQFLPNLIAAVSLNVAHPCLGATIALHREVLAQIGGFRRFADELADDYAIGSAVRALGREVVAIAVYRRARLLRTRLPRALGPPAPCGSHHSGDDPVGYAGTMFLTHPLALSVVAAILGWSGSFLLISAALICRLALCWAIERAFALPRHRYALISVQDAIAFAIFLTSFFGRKVDGAARPIPVADEAFESK